MEQNLFNLCKVVIKNEIKRNFNPNCKFEVIKRKDGYIYGRSCKDKYVNLFAEPIATSVCKPLKKL